MDWLIRITEKHEVLKSLKFPKIMVVNLIAYEIGARDGEHAHLIINTPKRTQQTIRDQFHKLGYKGNAQLNVKLINEMEPTIRYCCKGDDVVSQVYDVEKYRSDYYEQAKIIKKKRSLLPLYEEILNYIKQNPDQFWTYDVTKTYGIDVMKISRYIVDQYSHRKFFDMRLLHKVMNYVMNNICEKVRENTAKQLCDEYYQSLRNVNFILSHTPQDS